MTFNKKNKNFVVTSGLDPDMKKVVQNFPESLNRYFTKSFQKCYLPQERAFMEETLLDIIKRCKQRGILF